MIILKIIKDAKFEFFRGDTYTRDFSVSGWSLDVSKVYFTVKEKEENKIPVLQKTLNNGITLVAEENGKRTYNLLICCNDTEKMKANKDYYFDIEIHSPGANGDVIKQTIITGILRLEASSTRACNEC